MSKRSVKSFVLALIFFMASIAATQIGLPSKAGAAAPNLYIFDLRDYMDNDPRCKTSNDGYVTRYGYDFLKMAAVLQGIVNRSSTGDKIYYIYNSSNQVEVPLNANASTFWLNNLSGSGKYLSGYTKINVSRDNFYTDIFDVFKSNINGIALWDENIPATSNVASTISGCDNYLPARKGGDLYTEIKSRLGSVPEIDLNTKFSGSYATIPETTIAATGSKKNDVYLWAKVKYIDSGKVNPKLAAYHVDGYSVSRDGSNYYVYENNGQDNLYNRMIVNADYYISNKAFFLDLSPTTNRAPNDDPTQPVGTDSNTFKTIMAALRAKAGTDIITVGGFTAWQLKYTASVDSNLPVATTVEWETVDLISKYYAQLDADAPGLMALANASVFQFVPLNTTFTQTNDKGANGKIYNPNKRYICMYMGDYDAAAWTSSQLPALWNLPGGRGRIPLAWGIVPNLSKRVPQAFNYLYDTATSKDYFISGDNGAGYLNPVQLNTQDRTRWTQYNTSLFNQFDMSIAGFVITTNSSFPLWLQTEYSQFAPDGVSMHHDSDHKFENGTPFIKMASGGGTLPATGEAVEASLQSALDSDPSRKFWIFRSVVARPDYVANGVISLINHNPDVEVVDPYTLFRLFKQYNSLADVDSLSYNKSAAATDSNSTGEGPKSAVDGDSLTHWCSTATGDRWLTIDLGSPQDIVNWVVWHAGAAGESTTYNTKNFKLQTSNDNLNFVDRDVVSGNTASITNRNIAKVNARYVRLYITTPNQITGTGSNIVRINEFAVNGKFVSGFETGGPQPDWENTADFGSINVSGATCKIVPGEKVHSGSLAIKSTGTDNSATQTYCYNKVFDVNIPIVSTSKLSYYSFPENENGRHVGIELIFTDGTTLRDSGALTTDGVRMHPTAAKGTINTWNLIESNIGQWLNGKIIDRILVAYDNAGSTGNYTAYIDDISIVP